MAPTRICLTLLTSILVKICFSNGVPLNPNGQNVQTTYQVYYVSEGTSKLTYYYVRTCTRTCKPGAHVMWCWQKITKCTSQRRSYWKTIYKSVTRYRPIYRCRAGWKKRGSSCPIPECYGCSGHGYCNRPWRCTCNSGWTGTRCNRDVDECNQSWRNRCSYRAGCKNNPGSYTCTCAKGYSLNSDRRTCNDINECSGSMHGCSYAEGCQNTRGSYKCTCKEGYYLKSNQRTCEDINECDILQNDCVYKTGCKNTIGSYVCTCLLGYYLDADGKTCKDVNECDTSDCQQNCINYPGGYNCSCYPGYRVKTTDYKHCSDIDECSEKLAGCSQLCINTFGGFHCDCNQGYYLSWDKKFCNDIDECKNSAHGCQHTCENTIGTYKCHCRAGFLLSRDGKSCIGQPCFPIYTPVNGQKTCTGYTTEHKCSFSCPVGYKQTGSSTRTCSASKHWSGKETKCIPIHCSVPSEPTNGFIYSPCNTRFNSECLTGCNNGFYINETAKLVCTLNGKWEPTQITCKEIKVCEPNPCSHGGECIISSSRQFSCDCSNTGYEGTKCEIGVIDIPDYPPLVAGVPVETVEFRASPPDNYVILKPQGVGVEFDPQYLLFQRSVTTKQSLKITARKPGLHYVRYYLSGPSAAGYQIPQSNTFYVESLIENITPDVFTTHGSMVFPSGCYKLELEKCLTSNVTISAYSTSPWLMFGPTATSEGQVSLSNGNFELPHSITGYSFIPKDSPSLNKDCLINSEVKYPSIELIKRRVLMKSFLNVVRRSLPKWLDIKLRGNRSSTSLVETDLQAFYLTGKRLREEAFIEGQPLSDDTFFSLLLSPDLDLIVNGDRVSFGMNDRNVRFSVALELCGAPPNNVILRPSPENVDVMNQLSVIKQLRDIGWILKIFSLQVGGSAGKKSLTMVSKFTKKLAIPKTVKVRVDFHGTLKINVDNLNSLLQSPLHKKWVVDLYGNIMLTMEVKVEGKITTLVINMPQSKSYATFGGVGRGGCLRDAKNISDGLHLTRILEEDPFIHTELRKFVELDLTKNMSCFLSTIFYTKIQSSGSRYREESEGIVINFYGHLKFAALQFDNLDVKMVMKNPQCLADTTQKPKLGFVAELSGGIGKEVSRKFGMFEIQSDSVVTLHIGHEKSTASGGFFLAQVNVLGFQNRVMVNISQNNLSFHAKGKMHGLFDASAIFRSDLFAWNDQRYTASGVFEIKGADDNIDSLLEKMIKRYSTELLTKLQNRLDLSVDTEERAKRRLRDVKILHKESVIKMVEIIKENKKVNDNLHLAERHLDHLLALAEDYSDEIQQLKQDLDELCELKQCPKICEEGKSCVTCFEYVIAKKTGKCPATCHQTEQKRIPPLEQNAICKNEYCKRIHAVHSWLGDLLGIVIGVGGTLLGVPPSVSFAIGKGVSQFTRSVEMGKPDVGAFLSVPVHALNLVGVPKAVTGILGNALKGNTNPVSYIKAATSSFLPKKDNPGLGINAGGLLSTIAKHTGKGVGKVLRKTVPIVGGVMSLIEKREGRWKCEFKEEKCTKGRFEYKYNHHPYNCDLPCEKQYVKKEIQKSCCSIVPCASSVVNVSCMTENALFKTARKKALELLSKVKANAVNVLGNLENANQNISFWKMKKEIMSSKVRSASRSMNAYKDAVRGFDKAFNITMENRKRKWKIFEKSLMLRNHLNELGEPRFKIENINFYVKVSPESNTTLLPINITVTLSRTQRKQVTTVLDFKNLNRSLRSIAKEILGAYVRDTTRISRTKRSTENKNTSTGDTKYYTLQTFHRLCSEFSSHKNTLYEAAMSLYNLSSEIWHLLQEEAQREKFLAVNNSAIFQKVNVNRTKASQLGIVVNYNSFSDALANDPELSEARHLQQEALKNEFLAVHVSSKLLHRNWLATMENIFEEFSEECSGFDDCLKYSIDSLVEIIFETSIRQSEELVEGIRYVEEMFANLTREPDISVNKAVTISWNILQVLKNMTGVEGVCAQAPNITTNPTPFIELGVNKTLILMCNATGDSLVYQWMFDGENLKNQSTNILRIDNVSPLHSGNYSCSVSNHVAKASSIPAVVVIGTPPVIVHHPLRRLNVILSGFGTLLCQVKKNARNISYQWWFNQLEFGSFIPLPNETFSHLSFTSIKASYEGWYFCTASNSFGDTTSLKSFVKVLKYSLPVPVAKLSLTVISESSNNASVFYKDTLANVLASRLVTFAKKTQPSENPIKELNPTSCRQILQGDDGFARTETCDWTFRIIGENVSLSTFHSSPSQQINEIIRSTFKLKRAIGRLGNDTNAGNISFSLDNSNFYSPENSLGIIKMSLICPEGQILVENVYKCADCPPGSYAKMENGVATCTICPRGSYQSNPGQKSCIKCQEGFVTAEHGAYDQRQCNEEDGFYIVFLLVNNYHGEVLVTTNISSEVEVSYLKPTKTLVKTKKWKTKRVIMLNAVDASTHQTVGINGKSVVRLQPTNRKHISLKVLEIYAPEIVNQTPPVPAEKHVTEDVSINVAAMRAISAHRDPVLPSTTQYENPEGSAIIPEEMEQEVIGQNAQPGG